MKKPGEYFYLSMSEDPLRPGGSALHHGRPPYERMGCKISFEDLPEDCRRLVLDIYQDLWGLKKRSPSLHQRFNSLPDAR